MDIPLIPRKVLFGNPDKASVQLSPDGKMISYLAPLDGVLNVWVAPRDEIEAARPVTADKGRGIRFYGWAFTSAHVIYLQDLNGDENWRFYRVDLESGDTRDLTPFEGVQAQPQAFSHKSPEEAIVGINNRDPQYHDLYRVNLVTGSLQLLEQNERFLGYFIDDDFRVVHAMQMELDGSITIYARQNGEWQAWDQVPQEDTLTTNPIGFNKANTRYYQLDSRGRNTAALYEVDLATRQKHLLAEDVRVDTGEVVTHPTEKNVQAVSFIYDRKQWQVLDPAIEADFATLQTVASGELHIASRTLDDLYWIVEFNNDHTPAQFYLYDRQVKTARFLFSNRKELEGYPLAHMNCAIFPARDGLELVGYYSLPLGSDSDGDGIPDRPLPMVLLPHGGPWGRDHWGFNPFHQWLANRGYVAMDINFRSSTGFGKAFTNAGDKEWGGKIIQDQEDATRWAIERGIADPQKVGIMGGSFGGYSTLAGLTFFPEVYACGVDLVGPSNLITLIETVPPYWKPVIETFATRMGDFRTDEGRELLKKHSPLTYADRICRPLLIGQGANDPRVKQAESDQIVAAMQSKNIPVTYVLYSDEGHGFARPENKLSFNAIAEAFLAKCLGGRYEPVGGDFKGSSLQVVTGADDVPGLAEAMSEPGG